MDSQNKKIGLALSGGGYRAAAYHLGTLEALDRLGILNKVDVISAVSGGSITAAYFALHKNSFTEFKDFKDSLISRLQKGVLLGSYINLALVIVLSALLICSVGWWTLLPELVLLFFLWYKIFPFSFWIQREYDNIFFNQAKLLDLPDSPLIAINSTDIATGTLFTFSKQKMSGYQYEGKDKKIIFKHEKFPISKAVMASSCVPFAFSPITVNRKYYNVQFKVGEKKPLLIDGGLYDNQGAHKLTENKSIYYTQRVIISDAGVGEMNSKWAFNIPLMLVKTSNVMMRRIKTFQVRNNIYSENHKDMNFAYLCLGWDISDRTIYGFVENMLENNVSSEVIQCHKLPQTDLDELRNPNNFMSKAAKSRIVEQLKLNINWQDLETRKPRLEEHELAKSIGTNLTALRKEKIDALIKHSNWLTELQIRLYLPDLVQ